MILLRPARPDEAAFLTELCLRSKAVWGYDEHFMAACRSEVAMTPDTVAASCTMVAEISGRIVGVAQVSVHNSEAELDRLFIEPDSLRSGVGRGLLNWAKAEASKSGAAVLFVDSDPYAAAFYRRCGATDVGLVPSGSIPGRSIPRLRFVLSDGSMRAAGA
jgi:GNAT superfamily N-acetyltransferase